MKYKDTTNCPTQSTQRMFNVLCFLYLNQMNVAALSLQRCVLLMERPLLWAKLHQQSFKGPQVWFGLNSLMIIYRSPAPYTPPATLKGLSPCPSLVFCLFSSFFCSGVHAQLLLFRDSRYKFFRHEVLTPSTSPFKTALRHLMFVAFRLFVLATDRGQ